MTKVTINVPDPNYLLSEGSTLTLGPITFEVTSIGLGRGSIEAKLHDVNFNWQRPSLFVGDRFTFTGEDWDNNEVIELVRRVGQNREDAVWVLEGDPDDISHPSIESCIREHELFRMIMTGELKYVEAPR